MTVIPLRLDPSFNCYFPSTISFCLSLCLQLRLLASPNMNT